MKRSDSFELLRATEQFQIPPHHELSKLTSLESQLSDLKAQNISLQKQNQKLSESLLELRQTHHQTKLQLKQKALQLTELKTKFQKQSEKNKNTVKEKEGEIRILQKQLEGKEKEVQEIKIRLIQVQTELSTKDDFKASIMHSMAIPSADFSEKLAQLTDDLQKRMSNEIEFCKTIERQKQEIDTLKKDLKKSKTKYVKLQVDLRGQLEQKEEDANGLRELIKKYRESRSKIQMVFELEDAIKRVFLEELKGSEGGEEKGREEVMKKKEAVEKRLCRIVEVVGNEVVKEREKIALNKKGG